MSTIWTPSGERPVRPQPDGGDTATPPAPGRGPGRPPEPGEPSDEELRAHLADLSRQLLETPAAVVIANHCVGLFQLAALHLETEPANLDDAKLAIDAFGAIVETLGRRLGEEEPTLREALAQLRLGYVQRQRDPGTPPA